MLGIVLNFLRVRAGNDVSSTFPSPAQNCQPAFQPRPWDVTRILLQVPALLPLLRQNALPGKKIFHRSS